MSEATREHFPDFVSCLTIVQRSLGLGHYSITVEEIATGEDYATADVDPEGCLAHIRWHRGKCQADRVVAETALHEMLHVLLADLTHAVSTNLPGAKIEEERIVRRLEPVLARCVFG